MSNWSIPAASRCESLGAGTGTGTTVTTSGSSNTKGSYATIGTTSFAYRGFHLQLVSNSGTRFRLDVAVNNGGADSIIVEDFYYDSHFSSAVSGVGLYFPVAVASGGILKVRAQAAATTQSFIAMITGYATDFPGPVSFRACRSGTDFTNTDPSNNVAQNGTTQTAWVTVAAATTARFSGIYVVPACCADTTRTASKFIVDIGVGSAGNEKVIATILGEQNGSGPIALMPGPICVDIPSGSRLASRVQCSAAAADSFNVAINGLVS